MSDPIEVEIKWSSDIENMLKEKANDANGKLWLHKKCKTYYSKRDRNLSIINMILSVVTTTAIFGTIQEFSDCSENIEIQIGIGMFTLLMGVVTGLKHILQYPAKAEQHNQKAIGFNDVFDRIKNKLDLRRNNRIAHSSFIDEINNDYSKLNKPNTDIPDKLNNKYEIKKKKGEFDIIKINNDQDSEENKSEKDENKSESVEIDINDKPEYVSNSVHIFKDRIKSTFGN